MELRKNSLSLKGFQNIVIDNCEIVQETSLKDMTKTSQDKEENQERN